MNMTLETLKSAVKIFVRCENNRFEDGTIDWDAVDGDACILCGRDNEQRVLQAIHEVAQELEGDWAAFEDSRQDGKVWSTTRGWTCVADELITEEQVNEEFALLTAKATS